MTTVTARGGSFGHHPVVARASCRDLTESPDFKLQNLGLRIVLSLEE